MPRPSIHFGTSTSPHHSSSTVNEVVSAISRKLTSSHVEEVAAPKTAYPPAHRRPSFSMENILHSKKDAKARSDSKDRVKNHEKRHSILSSKTKAPSPQLPPVVPGKLDVVIESPPLVFYGNATHSTGALLSGRMKLDVQDPTGEVTLESFEMALRAVITTRKPVAKDCNDCRTRYDEIHRWKLLKNPPSVFRKGKDNQFPFSYLLQGHMAASTSGELGSIKYELAAKAKTVQGETIEFTHPILIQRAIPPGLDKSSIRIFPPTNLTGRVQLPPVVHPIGKFPLQMTLSGVVERKSTTITRWRLRKVLWRIEENCTMVSKPCSRHLAKVSDGKAVQHTESKIIGHDELKSGWKTDFDTAGGEILLEFEAALSTKSYHKVSCDVDSPAGLQVTHNLIVELIVAEEFVPIKNPSMITPTGSARVLRMQFNLVVTERAGMGISWDEEMPPTYEDVPASPPGYGSSDINDGAFGGAIMEDYEGPELEYIDLERMQSEDPNSPPIYRERDPAVIYAGLSLRSRPSPSPRTSNQSVDAGPSGTRHAVGHWTEDELGAEPPQYAMRGRQGSDTSQPEPETDFGEGSAGEAATR